MTLSPYDVLNFWFGAPGAVYYGKRRDEWFRKSDAFDALIRSRFLPLYEQVRSGELALWRDSPLTLLALIIVLDQFPRNMFRASPRAFESDALALDSARRMTTMRWDQRLNVHERQFAYLPFEHAENLDDQRRSLQLFKALSAEPLMNDLYEWAHKHFVIVERYGRFPHRNAIVGRASTPAEIEFLKQPGSGF